MRILIVGANSAIARAVARNYATRGDDFFLVGRDAAKLKQLSDDLRIRGAGRVATHCLDLGQLDGQRTALESAQTFLGVFDLTLICHGSLPDQVSCETNPAMVQHELLINGSSTLNLLIEMLPVLKSQGTGTLVVITSVAGDRGRPSNYVYGASKAMLSTFLQGLRARLFRHGVHVLEVRPGLVDTPMTAHLPKNFLFSSPELVARRITRAIARRRNVVYVPGYWRLIMTIVWLIPEPIFKRLDL